LQWLASTLESVDHLRLREFDGWDAYHETYMTLFARFKGVRALGLSDFQFMSCAMLMDIVALFPLLERLDLNCTWQTLRGRDIEMTYPALPLRNMLVVGAISLELCACIRATGSLSALDTLSIECNTTWDDGAKKRGELLRTVAPSLKRLQFLGFGSTQFVGPEGMPGI
jgi:hypothetical protein